MENTAIVVLGALNDERGVLADLAKERCDQAISEFRRHAGSRMIPTGGWGQHFNTTAKPHSHYLREYLTAHGVPDEAIAECVESSNTIEDARLCRPVVERYGFRKLVVVTSDFHVARARYIFTQEFSGMVIEFSGSRTHLPEEEFRARVAHEQRALARLKLNPSI